jgi:hypothetical protein
VPIPTSTGKVLLDLALDSRSGIGAGLAPGSEEIEDHNLPGKFVQRDGFAGSKTFQLKSIKGFASELEFGRERDDQREDQKRFHWVDLGMVR